MVIPVYVCMCDSCVCAAAGGSGEDRWGGRVWIGCPHPPATGGDHSPGTHSVHGHREVKREKKERDKKWKKGIKKG